MSSIRIQKDVASLYKMPPADTVLLPDTGADLRRISFLLLGPESTAYYGGAWRVALEVPAEYPQQPPKAYFETKIFHPNVQPSTGEVCVDTLKRDWSSKLNFGQIILPNPESSLNEEAGKLLLEDYSAFERTARVMTKVHALSRAEVIEEYGVPGGEDASEKPATTPSTKEEEKEEEEDITASPLKSGDSSYAKKTADPAKKEAKPVLSEKTISIHDNDGNIPAAAVSCGGGGGVDSNDNMATVHALETEADGQPALKKKKKASSATKKKMGLRRL